MVVACAIGSYRHDGEVGWLVMGGLFIIGAVWLVALMTIPTLRQTGAAGTHLVIVGQVEQRKVELRRSRFMRVLLRMEVVVKQDVLALGAAVVLIAGRPRW